MELHSLWNVGTNASQIIFQMFYLNFKLKTQIAASQAALAAEAHLQKINQPIMPSDGQALRYRSIAQHF